MTGQQAPKKFGISMLTFYRWRGPVREGLYVIAPLRIPIRLLFLRAAPAPG